MGDKVLPCALQLEVAPCRGKEHPALSQEGGPQLGCHVSVCGGWAQTYKHLLCLGYPGKLAASFTVLEDVLPGAPVVERGMGEVVMHEVGGGGGMGGCTQGAWGLPAEKWPCSPAEVEWMGWEVSVNIIR